MRLAGCSGRRSDAIAVAGALTICWSECGSVWGLRRAACVGRPFLAGTSPSQLRPTAELAIAARRDHRQTTLKRGARCLVGSLRQIGRTDNAQLVLAAGLCQRDFTSIAARLVSGATWREAVSMMKISCASGSTAGSGAAYRLARSSRVIDVVHRASLPEQCMSCRC